ncbi:hypothetical protein GCM10009789_54660 [Kribbella sancticallisti]|uniref:Uncharacterized protein n=1 Tax=Kribbella sancticallisti TaxID=460087 RepID=A0ABN2E3W1_9ACTN
MPSVSAGPLLQGDDFFGGVQFAFEEPVGEVDAGEPAAAAGGRVAVVHDAGVDDLGTLGQPCIVGAVGSQRPAVDQARSAQKQRPGIDARKHQPIPAGSLRGMMTGT